MNNSNVNQESKEWPLVSICCTCYNHEAYIRQTLDGFIMQKATFHFEIIIFDDASNDNTQKIIKEYAYKYPNLFRLFLQRENLWQKKKISGTQTISLPNTRGKYIAFCEGDDYWIDPYKLQKQVDFMESNPDYSLIYSRVKVFDESAQNYLPDFNNVSEIDMTYDIQDLAKGNFIHTPSVLFRKESIDISYIIRIKSIILDYLLWMLCAEKGKIKYLPDIMAVYRVWDGSVWQTKPSTFRTSNMMNLINVLIQYFSNDPKIKDILLVQLYNLYKDFRYSCIKNDDKQNLYKETNNLLKLHSEFQYFLFKYLSVIKENKMLRFKYFFYLLNSGKLDSLKLIKWCVV